MENKKQYTPIEVLKILGNELYEIRLLTKFTQSMYTKDLDTLEKKLKSCLDKNSNAYFTLNELNSALYSRPQSEIFLSDKKLTTTSDNDIVSYRWLLVDLDPNRPTGVASSSEEKEKALIKVRKMFKAFKKNGLKDENMIIADSGNGYHILVRVDFENSKNNIALVKQFLETLDFYFTDEHIQVDTKNFNPSRITKLYGTYSRKGSNTDERPHRQSNLIFVPDEIQICDIGKIKAIANLKPKENKVSKANLQSNNNIGNFNANDFINEFVAKHHIQIVKDTTNGGIRRMVLATCPFNSSHNQDSMIGVADNMPYFSCFHNSCSDNHWREFRLLYEPNFEVEREEKKKQYEENKSQKSNSNYESKYPKKINIVDTVENIISNSDKAKEKSAENKSVIDETKDFFTLEDGILSVYAENEEEKIQGFSTGFKNLDSYLENGVLSKGTFTIMSGDNSAGKSTFINQMILNVANQGYKSMIYSGELEIKRFTKWLLRQACGTNNMEISKKGNYYVPKDKAKLIASWSKDKIFLYNNKKSQKVSEIIKKIIWSIENQGTELIVIDNLMSMETSELGNDFGTDKQIIKASIEIAKNYNVHIVLIAHPRKSNGYLRKNDICGEKNIANLADNIFIMHRVNDDFLRAYYEFKKGKKWFEGCKTGYEDFGNVLEICKNRDNGQAIDKKVPFYFDVNSSRFFEEENQSITYDWEKLNNENDDVEKIERKWGDEPF